jgi:hypothetical protein
MCPARNGYIDVNGWLNAGKLEITWAGMFFEFFRQIPGRIPSWTDTCPDSRICPFLPRIFPNNRT